MDNIELKLKVRIPGKTFVFGEYAVLHHGEAVVAAHAPFFELDAVQGDGEDLSKMHSEKPVYKKFNELFHPASPAGILIQENEPLHGFYGRMISPYTQGGFGTSSAEFIAVHKILEAQLKKEPMNSFEGILKNYLEICLRDDLSPSGADILAQVQGGLVHVNKSTQVCTNLSWPFTDVEMHFIPTGVKLATHSHLGTYTSRDLRQLHSIFCKLNLALINVQQDEFLQLISFYAKELDALGLVHENTRKILEKLNGLSGVLACKGCGAMGADVVVAFVSAKNSHEFKSHFPLTYTELSRGAHIL